MTVKVGCSSGEALTDWRRQQAQLAAITRNLERLNEDLRETAERIFATESRLRDKQARRDATTRPLI